MISCTEYIPAYSELFKFIDQKSGRQAVYDYWAKFFDPKDFPLGRHVARSGLRGCWDYWTVIFAEEACDSTLVYSPQEGWLTMCMHACPSKGRFRKLGYLEPFDEYCRHCDGYDAIVAAYGLRRSTDYRGTDKAACRMLIADPQVFRGDEAALMEQMYRCEEAGCRYGTDPAACPLHRPGVMVQHCQSAELAYLHPQFHASLEINLHDLLERYGEEGVREYLSQYVAAFHKPLIRALRQGDLEALAQYLQQIYEKENASDALTLEVTGSQLHVRIAYSPAIRYIRGIGQPVREIFKATTQVVYEALAQQSGIGFQLTAYDLETGAAAFRFFLPEAAAQ